MLYAHEAASRPKRPAQSTGAVRDPERSGARPSAQIRRVLIVEDFEDVRTLYAQILRGAGFDVFEAADGRDAMRLAVEQRPDAIIMDLQMPEMDGWEAARQIRAHLGAAPLILAVSAHSSDESRREAYDAGCDSFIAKPLTPDVLLTIVSAALRKPG